MEIKEYRFKDDGKIPNSKLPLLVYKDAFNARGDAGAKWLEKRFAENDWKNSWRNGVFDYHHYHSITHEVLGVYSGKAVLKMGGEKGEEIEVVAGDILVIPAGVGHKNLGSDDFKIVGAYPGGSEYDMNTGKEGERPRTDQNIRKVPKPDSDPLLGKQGGVVDLW